MTGKLRCFCPRVLFPECPAGFYGADCRQRCLCQNGATCNRTNGKCTCVSGWTGTACELGKSSCTLPQNHLQMDRREENSLITTLVWFSYFWSSFIITHSDLPWQRQTKAETNRRSDRLLTGQQFYHIFKSFLFGAKTKSEGDFFSNASDTVGQSWRRKSVCELMDVYKRHLFSNLTHSANWKFF